MQNADKPKNGNRNKNAVPKGKVGEVNANGERGVHTFVAGKPL